MNGHRPGERGLTRRDMWPGYVGGLLTEVGFIAGLTVIAFVLALVARAVF